MSFVSHENMETVETSPRKQSQEKNKNQVGIE